VALGTLLFQVPKTRLLGYSTAVKATSPFGELWFARRSRSCAFVRCHDDEAWNLGEDAVTGGVGARRCDPDRFRDAHTPVDGFAGNRRVAATTSAASAAAATTALAAAAAAATAAAPATAAAATTATAAAATTATAAAATTATAALAAAAAAATSAAAATAAATAAPSAGAEAAAVATRATASASCFVAACACTISRTNSRSWWHWLHAGRQCERRTAESVRTPAALTQVACVSWAAPSSHHVQVQAPESRARGRDGDPAGAPLRRDAYLPTPRTQRREHLPLQRAPGWTAAGARHVQDHCTSGSQWAKALRDAPRRSPKRSADPLTAGVALDAQCLFAARRARRSVARCPDERH
jgi:hypothetical protein